MRAASAAPPAAATVGALDMEAVISQRRENAHEDALEDSG